MKNDLSENESLLPVKKNSAWLRDLMIILGVSLMCLSWSVFTLLLDSFPCAQIKKFYELFSQFLCQRPQRLSTPLESSEEYIGECFGNWTAIDCARWVSGIRKRWV